MENLGVLDALRGKGGSRASTDSRKSFEDRAKSENILKGLLSAI